MTIGALVFCGITASSGLFVAAWKARAKSAVRGRRLLHRQQAHPKCAVWRFGALAVPKGARKDEGLHQARSDASRGALRGGRGWRMVVAAAGW